MSERFVLASGSPRRRELLTQIGIRFEVIPALSEERTTCSDPAEICRNLASAKAEEVAQRILDARAACISQEADPGISRETALSRSVRVIGADTIVVLGREILGKPKDAEDAARMLGELSGRAHEVMTGVCVVELCEGRRVSAASFTECTKVFVSRLSQKEISDYIATGEPFDKAGAYGIQGLFARYIERIEGDYNNVVGLPAGRLYREFLSEGR